MISKKAVVWGIFISHIIPVLIQAFFMKSARTILNEDGSTSTIASILSLTLDGYLTLAVCSFALYLLVIFFYRSFTSRRARNR